MHFSADIAAKNTGMDVEMTIFFRILHHLDKRAVCYNQADIMGSGAEQVKISLRGDVSDGESDY